MKRSFLTLCAIAGLAVPLFAAEATEDDEALAGDEEVASVAAKAKKSERLFSLLPYCRRIEGRAEVMRPGADKFVTAEEGKFYPLGSVYRAIGKDTRLVVRFGTDVEVEVIGNGSFGTRPQALNEDVRAINLLDGSLTVRLPSALPERAFVVSAPGFAVVSARGEAVYSYTKLSDGDEATVRCVTGEIVIEGRHFKTLPMLSTNELRIRTSTDQLASAIYGKAGEITLRLDQGDEYVQDYETGNKIVEARTLDWALTPGTAVRIYRQVPKIGSKLAVTVMTFDDKGKVCNRRAFTEHTVEVNSGELAPSGRKLSAKLQKEATAAAEKVESEANDDEELQPEADTSNDEESTDEEVEDDDNF